MASTTLCNPFGQVYPEHHRCENCIHWRGDWSSKVYAKVNGSTVWVSFALDGLIKEIDPIYPDTDHKELTAAT